MARLQAGFIQARPALLLAAVLAYACGGEVKPGGPTEPQPSKKLAALVVSPTAMALFSGDEMPVNAAAVDADGKSVTGTVIRWASSDTMVASIDGNGVARARGNGDAVITVSADTFRVRVSVQVNAAADAVNTKLSTNAFFLHQEEPSITIDAVGRVLVGWKEMDAPAGVNRVAFSASMDNGQTWTSPTLMDLGTGIGASDPWLATDKSGALLYARVHTTRALPWIDPWRIVVSRSTDGGLTWGELVVTNQGNGADKPALHRDATGNLLLAYVSFTTTKNEIAVSRSLDNGATWEASRTIPGAGSLSGLELVASRVEVNGVAARYVRSLPGHDHESERGHHHHHHQRLSDILEVIARAKTSEPVRARARSVFEVLAAAEAAVHGGTADDVELHEVGELDSIMDVLGIAVALDLLGNPAMSAAPLPSGRGTVHTSHGELEVPVPAVREIARRHGIRLDDVLVRGETVTPTGIAVLAQAARAELKRPLGSADRVGVGAGTRRFSDRPNVVRLHGWLRR